MPTLNEFRRWLRGERVPGLPSWPRFGFPSSKGTGFSDPPGLDSRGEDEEDPLPPPRLDLKKVETRKTLTPASGRYTIQVDGRDASLHFGKYSGMSLREIYSHPGGSGYLRWMLMQGFPEELKRIVQDVLDGR
jgi:uncharacterized protein (DUF3820 family)